MKEYHIRDYQYSYENLYDTLRESARKYPDKTAVIDDKESVTYQELLKRVDELAWTLKIKYQMREQEQIGFVMVNSADMVMAFYAAMKLGCIAVMINTKLQAAEIKTLLQEMEVKLVISDSRWLPKIIEPAGVMQIKHILTELTDFDREPAAEQMEPVRNMENTAVIMHTSGTTGPPKGVMVTHRNILEAAYGYQEVQRLDQSALTVLSVPLFHILGLSCVTTQFIFMGATIVLSEFYRVEDVLGKIRKYQATHFHSVPAIYLQIIRSDHPDKDLTSLKTAVCGGAPIRKEHIDAFCELAPNAVFHLAYGMTETAGSGALSSVHKGELRAVPNVYMKVVDTKHNELAPGEIGEIVFCGPCVARGRWKGERLPDANMYSGDVGYMDEEGRVYVIDRLKDIINRGGEKIFPVQIEAVILGFPGVAQAAVYAVSDDRYGEVPAAAVIAKKDEEIDMESLRLFLKERIAKFKLPVFIEAVKEFPVTQNGKIKKTELRRLAEERRIQN